MTKPSFFDKVANMLGYIKEMTVSAGSWSSFASPTRKQTTALREAYVSWVYACVKARSEEVAGIKLRLYKQKSGEAVEVEEHDVLSLLRLVNPWTTQRQLFEATQAYLDLAGECFWYLSRSKTGRIIQLWLLRPDWVTIKTDDQNWVSSYIYRAPGGNAIEIKKEDIIHHKEFNPIDPYRGMSIVSAAAMTIDSEQFAEAYNRRFFENSAIPAVILQTEQKLDKTIIERMRAQWDKEYAGTDKAHRMAILEGGLKANPFAISQKEMEFLEGQRYSRDKILALFKTPKTVIGMTEDVTVSNAEATDYVFSKRTIKPLMEKIVDTLNEYLLPQYGDDLYFSFEDPVPENRTNKLETYKALFSLGAMTPNEIRAEEGLDEQSGLDQFYLPFSVAPVTQVTNPEDPDEEPVKRVKTKKKTPQRPKTLKDKVTAEIADEVTKEVMATITRTVKVNQDQRVIDEVGKSQWTDEQATVFWKGMVAKTDNYEAAYAKRIRQVFARQEKETISRLHASQKSADLEKALAPSDVDKILFKLSTENEVAIDLMLPLLKDIIENIGEDVLESVGVEERAFDMTEEPVRQFLKSNGVKGIRSTNKKTRKLIRDVLVTSIKDNVAIPEVARKIRGVFADASTSRAMKIARTEVLRATNKATVEAYKQSRVVVGKQWFTALDEMVCQWCAPMQGRTKAVDLPYFQEGETFVGKEGAALDLSFEEVGQPPLHPNCRCTIIPILGNG